MNNILTFITFTLLFISCSPQKDNNLKDEQIAKLQTQIDSLQKLKSETATLSKSQITTFLTFQDNNAEEAMNFYISIFKNSKVIDIRRYGKESPAKEGTIMMARFELDGSQFACSDSYIKHEWDFSPAVSNFVDCASEKELQILFTKLSERGKVLMPLANYGFSTKFGFVEDRFGVSWQLNLD